MAQVLLFVCKYTCFVIIFLWLSTFGGICIFLLEKVTNEARPLSYKLQNLTSKDQEGMKTHRLRKVLSEILTVYRWWCLLEVDSFESIEVKGSFYRSSQKTYPNVTDAGFLCPNKTNIVMYFPFLRICPSKNHFPLT